MHVESLKIIEQYLQGIITQQEAITRLIELDPDVLRQEVVFAVQAEWLAQIKDQCEKLREKNVRDKSVYIYGGIPHSSIDMQERNERWQQGLRAWQDYFGMEIEGDTIP